MIDTQDEIWAVEWNPKQKVAHIEKLEEMVVYNIRHIRNYDEKHFLPSFYLVGLADTVEDANDLAERVYKEFDSTT